MSAPSSQAPGRSGPSAAGTLAGSTTLEWVAVLASALLGFLWTWTCAARGFFALDQSIVFDGAWRLVCGQVPFVDFHTPHGIPVLLWTAGFFRVLGANHDSYVLAGASISALGSGAAAHLVLRVVSPALGRGRVGLGLLGGLLTALWFQTPFGTPYPEQFAFLTGLLALPFALPRRLDSEAPGGIVGPVVAGAVMFIGFLAKQNAGALVIPTVLLTLGITRPAQHRVRAWIGFALGFAAGALAFGVWLQLASNPAQFWRSYFEIPSEELFPRLAKAGPKLVVWLILGRGSAALPNVFLILSATAAYRAWRNWPGWGTRLRLAAAWTVLLHLAQNGFTTTTNNNAENGYGFTGLILPLGLWVGLEAWATASGASSGRSPGSTRWKLGLATFVLVGVVVFRGVQVGWERRVHPVYRDSTFSAAFDEPGWGRLSWGEPTPYWTRDVRIGDLESVLAHLRGRDGQAFVFPDHTFLYALLDQAPPQPLLWFHHGITFPKDYDESLDLAIVEALRTADVRSAVVEEVSFIGTHLTLPELPHLERFLREEFRVAARYGIFEVLER